MNEPLTLIDASTMLRRAAWLVRAAAALSDPAERFKALSAAMSTVDAAVARVRGDAGWREPEEE